PIFGEEDGLPGLADHVSGEAVIPGFTPSSNPRRSLRGSRRPRHEEHRTMNNLYAAHYQWMTRPADERFWGLDDLLDQLRAERRAARESRKSINDIRVEAAPRVGYDSPDLRLIAGDTGESLGFTHWSFGQLCSVADAPASYLRRLPPDLAAINLNH